MPDEQFTLRQADQARTDFAVIEDDLECLTQRVNQLPTASDLWRLAVLVALFGAAFGAVSIEIFWRYVSLCGISI
jgi:hypothetical protein